VNVRLIVIGPTDPSVCTYYDCDRTANRAIEALDKRKPFCDEHLDEALRRWQAWAREMEA